jgi:hypothetical protein
MRQLSQNEVMNISAGTLSANEVTMITAGVATCIAAPISIIGLGWGLGTLATFLTTGFTTYGAHTLGSQIINAAHSHISG